MTLLGINLDFKPNKPEKTENREASAGAKTPPSQGGALKAMPGHGPNTGRKGEKKPTEKGWFFK
jgi:hypothetical protein